MDRFGDYSEVGLGLGLMMTRMEGRPGRGGEVRFGHRRD